MHVEPRVEELEERSVPSAADLAAFQQQLLPSLETQFHALVPIVQSTLRTNLNQLEALAPLLPAGFQPVLDGLIVQGQQFVTAFPELARASFQQAVLNFELQLVAPSAVSPAQSAAVFPFFGAGFFPFFPGGFLGYPGVAPVGFGGIGSSSGFSSGSSGFSGGSFGSDPPTLTGQGMGVGLMSTAGALTLSPSNHP